MYAKNKSLKLFYEKYCFLPIAQFELNDSTDHLQYVNIFIVMKKKFTLDHAVQKDAYIHSKKLCMN